MGEERGSEDMETGGRKEASQFKGTGGQETEYEWETHRESVDIRVRERKWRFRLEFGMSEVGQMLKVGELVV